MSVINKIDFLLGDGFLREATEFQQFFKKKLKQYGVNSPADLPANKKKKFFDEVDREYKAKNESLSEATLQSIMMQFGPYKEAKRMGILNPKMSGPAGQVAAYPGTGKEHFHPEKQDQKMEMKDKGAVKSYPGSGKEHFHPDTQDTKIPTKDKGTVKSFPGSGKEHFHPEQQDTKIPTKDKGTVKSYPGSGKEHFHPDKQDEKIKTKDKGVVKSYPGSGKEHFHPDMQDTKIPTADKGVVKSFPGDNMIRHDTSVMGYKRQPMMEQSTEDTEEIQDKFGPKKYAKEKGLVDKKKKNKAMEEVMKDENKNIFEAYQRTIWVTNEEWLEYEKEYGETLDEKWAKKVKIEKTGEHAGKSVEQLKKEIAALKGKPGNKEKMGELLFALRSKTGWKKGKGAAGLGG